MIENLKSIFNNRELAIIIFVIVALIWFFRNKDSRMAFRGVVKAFVAHQILVSLFLMIIYIEGILIGFSKLGLWDFSLLKDTVFWTFGVAFIMLMNIQKIEKDEGFIRKSIVDNIKLVVILQFITNMYVFGFITEIILLPIILFLSMVTAYAELDEKNKQVVKITNTILSIYGLSVIIFSIIKLTQDFDSFATIQNLKSFLLTPIFTILYIPFIYFIGVFMVYQFFYVRIKLNLRNDKKLSRIMRFRIFMKCRLSLRKIKLVSKELKVFFIKDKKDLKVALNAIMKEGKHPIPDLY